MEHKKIRIPRESANEIMRAIGNLKNAVEFEDLTKDDLEAKKNFAEMIKRCDEIKKKIFDFTKVCYDFQLPFNYYSTYEEFQKEKEGNQKKNNIKSPEINIESSNEVQPKIIIDNIDTSENNTKKKLA